MPANHLTLRRLPRYLISDHVVTVACTGDPRWRAANRRFLWPKTTFWSPFYIVSHWANDLPLFSEPAAARDFRDRADDVIDTSYDVRVYPNIVREVYWILQHERKCTLAL